MSKKNPYLERIALAQQALRAVRDKTPAGKRSTITTTPKEWAIGAHGLLDFIATGDVNRVLLTPLREELRNLITPPASKQKDLEEIGHRGGQRVRKLIQEGKEQEE